MMIVYTGQDMEATDKCLTETFQSLANKAVVVRLPDDATLLNAMGPVMGTHSAHRDAEYLVIGRLQPSSQELLIAINHRFHDARVLGEVAVLRWLPAAFLWLLRQGSAMSRLGQPPSAGPPTGAAASSVVISAEHLANMKTQLGMTRNAVCLFIACCAIAAKAPAASPVMCLHSGRNLRHAEDLPGGDYTCYTAPMQLVPGSTPEATCTAVMTYLDMVRTGKATLGATARDTAAQVEDLWTYDSWIRSGVARPGAAPQSSIASSLAPFYSSVCKNLILAFERVAQIVPVMLLLWCFRMRLCWPCRKWTRRLMLFPHGNDAWILDIADCFGFDEVLRLRRSLPLSLQSLLTLNPKP